MPNHLLDSIIRRVLARTRSATTTLPFGPQSRMARLTSEVHPQTIRRHAELSRWAAQAAARGFPNEADPLLSELLSAFRDIERNRSADVRVLLHVAPPSVSPANASYLGNIQDGLSYVGLPARLLRWDEPISPVLSQFKPTVLLTSGSDHWLSKIDWSAVEQYRRTDRLLVGLGHAPEKRFQSDMVEGLLDWAERRSISFFYTWIAREAIHEPGFDRFRRRGFPVVSLEFAANPLSYRPVDYKEKDVVYAFVGSAHADKWRRYAAYFGPIVRNYPGFLLGPGWPTGPPSHMGPVAQSHVYGRTRVGLNIHMGMELREPRYLSERFYNLVAAGVPQVVDSPALALQRFGEESCFFAASPREYRDLFELAIRDEDEARRRADLARRELFTSYTVLHVASRFARDMVSLLGGQGRPGIRSEN